MIDIKNSFSDFLLDELDDHLSKTRVKYAKNILSKEVENEDDLNDLKENLKVLKAELPEDFYDYLWEEVGQIEDDLEWKKSENGKSILRINEWKDEFFSEFRDLSEFNQVFIGGHTEKEAVVIIGEVNSEDTLRRLKEYVFSKKPPFETIFEIEINS